MATIFLIDDNLDFLTFLKNVFHGTEYTTICCSNSKTASMEITLIRPDLIITDIFMTHVMGTEIIHRANAMNIPVIAISGGFHDWNSHDTLQMAEGIGADALLKKPVKMDDIIDTVHILLKDIPK
jgi:DNA-binding response OmpR family regulator